MDAHHPDFPSAPRLLQELRELGRNLHPARFAGLRGRRWKAGLEQALTERLAAPEHGGQLALTFEIVYGHAYNPRPGCPWRGKVLCPCRTCAPCCAATLAAEQRRRVGCRRVHDVAQKHRLQGQ